MDSEYVLLEVDSSDYVYEFSANNPLLLRENAEIGLKSIFFWHTFPNISEKYNNNIFKIFIDNNWKTVFIPEGMYDIAELNNFLQTNFGDVVHLSINTATFKLKIELKENAQFDLSEGNFCEILGFEPKLITNTQEGEKIINITRGVDRILIRCNLVTRPYQAEYKDVLYDILPVAQPGGAIYDNIQAVEFHRCKDRFIRQIKIKVTDIKGELLKICEKFTLKLIFRH